MDYLLELLMSGAVNTSEAAGPSFCLECIAVYLAHGRDGRNALPVAYIELQLAAISCVNDDVKSLTALRRSPTCLLPVVCVLPGFCISGSAVSCKHSDSKLHFSTIHRCSVDESMLGIQLSPASILHQPICAGAAFCCLI